jgi:hypothetical protein
MSRSPLAILLTALLALAGTPNPLEQVPKLLELGAWA